MNSIIKFHKNLAKGFGITKGNFNLVTSLGKSLTISKRHVKEMNTTINSKSESEFHFVLNVIKEISAASK